MSTLKVSTISPLGTDATKTITLGESGGTLSIASGANTSGFGKIGQVVSLQQTVDFTTSSTSYVDTGASATITPTSTSSKIYVVCNSCAGGQRTGSENDNQFGLTRDSGSTFLTEKRIENFDYGTSGTVLRGSFSIQYVDSPATVSAITYKIYAKKNNSTIAIFGQGTGTDTDWTLMEVLD